MNHHKSSSAKLLHLICVLPLLVLFALAFFGVASSALLVPLVMVLCCLAMFYLMADACGHGEQETAARHTPDDPGPPPPPDVKTDDVFRTERSRRVGRSLVLEGELLRGPDEAHETLRRRLEGTGTTALLQEDPAGRPLLVFLPAPAARPDQEGPGRWLNLVLFALTLVTTTWAGALHAGVNLMENPARFAVGLPYSLTLVLILGAHELGHYAAARYHRMRVTLPYFIPVPFGLGTFGAFIQLKSPAATRRAPFDVGVAGPLAGLVIAVPALWVGLRYSTVVAPAEAAAGMHGAGAGSSFLFALTAKLALGDAVAEGHHLLLHPLAFAGWLGLLVTALNLLPVGQLDGGHMADAMLGRRLSASVGTAAMASLVVLGLFVWSGLLTWALVVYLVAGEKGVPPLNDLTRLGRGRLAVGAFAFVLLFLILAPVPHRLYDALGMHCPYL